MLKKTVQSLTRMRNGLSRLLLLDVDLLKTLGRPDPKKYAVRTLNTFPRDPPSRQVKDKYFYLCVVRRLCIFLVPPPVLPSSPPLLPSFPPPLLLSFYSHLHNPHNACMWLTHTCKVQEDAEAFVLPGACAVCASAWVYQCVPECITTRTHTHTHTHT